MNLTPDLLLFAADLLEMASDEFAWHGCNDFRLDVYFPELKRRHEVMQEVELSNGTPEEFDARKSYESSYDWLMMSFMADVLRREAEKEK